MNIPSKVKEILATGLTQKEAAEFVGCSQATISDLATGIQTTTKFEFGLKIVELHKSVCKKSA